MKILHIAAHLGGGIGKAHAAMAPHFPKDVEQIFAILEMPIDRRHSNALMDHGSRVCVGDHWRTFEGQLVRDADIIQIEYWGHPALDKFIAGWRLPAPSVCWCHVSGLHTPLPWQLLDGVDRFVATSPITLPALPECMRAGAKVINSGFGFDGARPPREPGMARVIYLGTVDFKKMHPDFFAAIDEAACVDVEVWGHVSPEAAKAHGAMRQPKRIELRGHTLDPRAALAGSNIFFYPLRTDHYGTAENALIEAMSLGLVPIVLDNPAEMSIVTHGKTGIVAASIEQAVDEAQALAQMPEFRAELSRNAMAAVAQSKSPRASAAQFVDLWRGMLGAGTGVDWGPSAYSRTA